MSIDIYSLLKNSTHDLLLVQMDSNMKDGLKAKLLRFDEIIEIVGSVGGPSVL